MIGYVNDDGINRIVAGWDVPPVNELAERLSKLEEDQLPQEIRTLPAPIERIVQFRLQSGETFNNLESAIERLKTDMIVEYLLKYTPDPQPVSSVMHGIAAIISKIDVQHLADSITEFDHSIRESCQ